MPNGLRLGYKIYKGVMKIRQPKRGRTATVSYRTYRQYPERAMRSAFGFKLGPVGKLLHRRK